MDTDTTANKYALEKKLNAFANGEYDIMIGTQMVLQRGDFENVTLVGVLSADQSLYSDDYRSNERTFDLLTQVVGRAGARSHRGTHLFKRMCGKPASAPAAAQDYESFFETEIRFRRAMLYPPFCGSFANRLLWAKRKTPCVRQRAFLRCLQRRSRQDYPNCRCVYLRALCGIRVTYGRQIPI